uniref:hypothetical protein n=1 Tax=Bacillus subtilis TaxID=1423 RepID=UPI0011A2E301
MVNFDEEVLDDLRGEVGFVCGGCCLVFDGGIDDICEGVVGVKGVECYIYCLGLGFGSEGVWFGYGYFYKYWGA